MAITDDRSWPEDVAHARPWTACVRSPALELTEAGCAGHRAESSTRQMRVLRVTTRIAAVVSVFFGVQQFFVVPDARWLSLINVATAAVFLVVPKLDRFGELVPPVVFVAVAYASITVSAVYVGSGIGLQFYYVVAATIVVLILGIEHIALASGFAVLGAVTVVLLELNVPHDTGSQPDWAFRLGFIVNTAAAWVLVVATVWFALREIARAEDAMEMEYQRSESLLANILPVSIAERLKDPAHTVIADRYDDASILFADIAGYTKRASDTSPTDLVTFLDALYTDLDALVDRHGLEKVKTSGDSYMVVSGVPEARPDHLAALARLALDMAEAVAGLTDPQGREVPLRIGLAAGPVVAGVVGARKFFYDVWGDAVNVASRMESTDVEGRIQVPQDVYARLRSQFTFEERGDIDVKGKGVMHTWYLTGPAA
ncbi:adenylate/guanylate cyclase domain-containing protein [Mycolicibacterium sediminis]|uniref:Adenylate cyclase n=1 Tax=Mycolicibacterium sediminis TaxID=1286180 RepID=A0A7I7QVA8_9MYCO|nr:adenylate cyclase [Mycolicibacterium sediminis]